MKSVFVQLINAILSAGSICVARACGADAQTAIAIGTIMGTSFGNAASGVIDLNKKSAERFFNINEYARSN